MSVPMALVDYLPVVLFLVTAVILQRDLYHLMSKGAYSLFAGGTIIVFMAGFLKATWKLLYALNICDFVYLNHMFFPCQAIGFVLSGLGVFCMLFVKQGEGKIYSVSIPVLAFFMLFKDVTPSKPPVFSGTMIFVVLMIIGVVGFSGGLAILSGKKKQVFSMILFILSIFFMLMMGYLSSKDFSSAYMNWVAQGVNILGQGSLFVGTMTLHKRKLFSEDD